MIETKIVNGTAIIYADINPNGRISAFIVSIFGKKPLTLTVAHRGWRYTWVLRNSATIPVQGFYDINTTFETSV